MSEEEKNMEYTRFLIRTKLDKKLGIVLDPTKDTCRLGEKKDNTNVRCMNLHGADRCRLKDKYNINVTQVDLSALRELQSGGPGLVELERDGQEVAPVVAVNGTVLVTAGEDEVGDAASRRSW
jgi:hypothetical protein